MRYFVENALNHESIQPQLVYSRYAALVVYPIPQSSQK